MPPFSLGFTPSNIPDVEDFVNILTIAARAGIRSFTPIGNFTPEQKIAVFDLLFALGAKSQNPAYGFLHQKVHPSYIRNGDDRRVHMNYSNILLAGAVSGFKE